MEEYNLGSKSNIARIKEALLDRELIETSQDGVYLEDPVFRMWFNKKWDDIFQKVIAEKDHPREFDYEMEYDEEWKLVEWYLQDFPKKNKWHHGETNQITISRYEFRIIISWSNKEP